MPGRLIERLVLLFEKRFKWTMRVVRRSRPLWSSTLVELAARCEVCYHPLYSLMRGALPKPLIAASNSSQVMRERFCGAIASSVLHSPPCRIDPDDSCYS